MSVMIGIDPHKGSHTAVVVDSGEVAIDKIRVRTTATQLVQLQDWASRYDVRCWAIESARGMGYLLAQQLVAAGEQVVDVPPMMASRVRVLGSGKS
ncbi:MAG: transposase [Actinomycetota bacterium]|nr:transposase [Actinomycetota bacterium]